MRNPAYKAKCHLSVTYTTQFISILLTKYKYNKTNQYTELIIISTAIYGVIASNAKLLND